MRIIDLNHGQQTMLDDGDYEWAMQWKWRARKEGYTWYAERGDKGQQLHRELLERIIGRPLETGEETDHRNRNGLDNQRSNLRIATRQENIRNTCGRGGSSSYKGVHWSKRHRKWVTSIRSNKRYMLGFFTDEVEAAKEYDRAAVYFYGEFAYCNFPDMAFPGEWQPPSARICSSRYKGVSWNINRKAWKSEVRIKGISHFVGYFADENAAAFKHDRKLYEATGDLLKLNFPERFVAYG